jgi:hypothetical protein
MAGSVDDLDADGVTVAAAINGREPVSVSAGDVLAAHAGCHVAPFGWSFAPAFGLTSSCK